MSRATLSFQEGEWIAKLSFFTLVGICVIEVALGLFSNSITLTTDGADSAADAAISLIVWVGLRISRKAPDSRFHFGYLRVESLAALIASMGMIIVATALLYTSYLRLLAPQPISYTFLVIATLFLAGLVSLVLALRMRRIAEKSNALSLRTDAANSLKDATTSFIGASAIFVLTFGFPFMDAIGGMVIGAYIYSVAYFSIKEASLVLVDAFESPEVVDDIKELLERKYRVKVEGVRLRQTGPLITGEIDVLAEGKLTLDEVGVLRHEIKAELRKEIEGVSELAITFHSPSERKEVEEEIREEQEERRKS